MRRLALFLLVLLPAAVHAQDQPHFSIQAITYGQPGQVVVPEAINNRGQVTGLLAGQTIGPGDDWYPFFYSAGQATLIYTIGGQSIGQAINDHGQVVGGYTTRPGSFIWPGSTAPFGPPASNPYSGGSATDINDSGIVVGGPPAFMYQGGVVTDLGIGPNSSANGINNAGQIVGYSSPGAFLWQNGKVQSLPLFDAS